MDPKRPYSTRERSRGHVVSYRRLRDHCLSDADHIPLSDIKPPGLLQIEGRREGSDQEWYRHRANLLRRGARNTLSESESPLIFANYQHKG